MKRALRNIVYLGLLATVFAAAFSFAGCKSVDCSNSDTAEFPVQERWWK